MGEIVSLKKADTSKNKKKKPLGVIIWMNQPFCTACIGNTSAVLPAQLVFPTIKDSA